LQESASFIPTPEEAAIIQAVDKNTKAVVSIVISEDVPVIEQYYIRQNPLEGMNDPFGLFDPNTFNFEVPQYRQNGTQKQRVGAGTGFIIRSDGLIATNKHVVAKEEAEYTVFLHDGSKYTAKILARDPVNDLAFLKIDAKDLPTVALGSSDHLKVGQTTIAIGYALGKFDNSVSKGIISGLGRSIVAGDYGSSSEKLDDVIQTDTAINQGNSGGPLLNSAGDVIGVNVAIVQGSQNIGFAVPVNEVKEAVESLNKTGKIERPRLGLRYMLVTEELAQKNKLPVNYGALVVRGEQPTDLAFIPGGPADKAGIVENDIILKVEGQKINENNDLRKMVLKYKVEDKIELKVLHQSKEKTVEVVLGAQ
jgi:serine protease Do